MTDLGPALTLGQMVDRAAARFPDRTRSSSRASGSATRSSSAAPTISRAASSALGLGAGRSRRALDAQSRRVERREPRHRQDRGGDRHVQQPLQGLRGRVRAAAVGRQGPGHGGPVRGGVGRLPGDPARAARARRADRLPGAAPRDRAGRRAAPAGARRLRRRRAVGRARAAGDLGAVRGRSRRRRWRCSTPPAPPASRRAACSRTATCTTSAASTPSCTRWTSRGPVPGAGAVLPHLRLDGRRRRQLPRGLDPGADGRLRSARGHAAHRGRAGDDLLGRADDVHHDPRPPGVRPPRSPLAAHRLHRRRAGAGRDHAADPRPRARASAWTRWWSTGSPRPPGGTHWTRPGDPHREAGVHGGAAHRRDRGPGRGPRDRRRAAAGRGGRGLHQGADPDARLLQEARGHGGEDPRRLAPHRRHGGQGRGRLRAHHRAGSPT